MSSLLSIQIKAFNPRNASNELWEKFFTFDQVLEKEQYPNDPYPTKEYIKKTMQVYSNYNKVLHWIAIDQTSKGKIVGHATLYLTTKENPNFNSTKNIAEGFIKVLPAYRGRGIGKDLFLIIISKANEEGKVIFQSFAKTGSGNIFCRNLQGQVVLKNLENRLYFSDIKWNLLEKWRKECPIKAQGVTIEIFQDVPEKYIMEFVKLYTDISNQQPLGELEGRSKITSEIRRKTEKKMKEIGITWLTVITKEKNGIISGFSDIQYSLENSIEIRQVFTGVDKNYRGRCLGKWLKTEITYLIKNRFPRAKYITTENANSNEPMLSINKRIGFKKHIQEIGYKWVIEDLLDRFYQSNASISLLKEKESIIV